MITLLSSHLISRNDIALGRQLQSAHTAFSNWSARFSIMNDGSRGGQFDTSYLLSELFDSTHCTSHIAMYFILFATPFFAITIVCFVTKCCYVTRTWSFLGAVLDLIRSFVIGCIISGACCFSHGGIAVGLMVGGIIFAFLLFLFQCGLLSICLSETSPSNPAFVGFELCTKNVSRDEFEDIIRNNRSTPPAILLTTVSHRQSGRDRIFAGVKTAPLEYSNWEDHSEPYSIPNAPVVVYHANTNIFLHADMSNVLEDERIKLEKQDGNIEYETSTHEYVPGIEKSVVYIEDGHCFLRCISSCLGIILYYLLILCGLAQVLETLWLLNSKCPKADQINKVVSGEENVYRMQFGQDDYIAAGNAVLSPDAIL